MLEVRTILAVMSICSLLMACTLWVTFAGRMRDGLDKWAMAYVMQSATWSLYALHGTVPLLLSETTADAVLAMSWTLKLGSLLEFQQRPTPKRSLWGTTAISILLLLALSWLGYDREMLLFRGFIFALATLGIAWLAWQVPPAPTNRVRFLLVGVYIAIACGFLIRTWAVLWHAQALAEPLAPSGFQSLTFLLGFSFIIVSAFCILIMHKERADNENYLLAVTDPLTGVYNRRTFMELADKLLAHSARTSLPTGLLVIDIDYFKRVNDLHGHAVGDEVLKGVVARVRRCLRDEDMLMRFGGEEFCVLLPGADAEGARVLGERVRGGVAATPIQAGGVSIAITVSIGAATVGHDAVRAKEALFANADRALYEAKGAGRNRVMVGAAT